MVLFDPLTWETHALARDGLQVLAALNQLAAEGDPHAAELAERAIADFVREAPAMTSGGADEARARLMPWAELVLHIRALGEVLPNVEAG